MGQTNHRVPLLAIVATLVLGASAQTPPYATVTPAFLRTVAQQVRQELDEGWVQMADLHAVELRLALHGDLQQETADGASVMAQTPDPARFAPQFTRSLLPVVDKLIEQLDDPDLKPATATAEQLCAQIHRQQELYVAQQQAVPTSDPFVDRYFKLSRELFESLKKGDIANAAVLAPSVQSMVDTVRSNRKYRGINLSANIYNINDALGRAAFLAHDNLAAGDYLLKAADNPGTDPALRTFGPDLWLARALLNAGQRDVVLTFLERVKTFWPKPQLDEWIATIKNGGAPDLSHNIFSAAPVPN